MHTRCVEISSGDLQGPARPVCPPNNSFMVKQAYCFMHRCSAEINSGDIEGPAQPVCMFYRETGTWANMPNNQFHGKTCILLSASLVHKCADTNFS